MEKMIDFAKAHWIDVICTQKEDSHAEFKGAFFLSKETSLDLRISCDSDYAFYLNGKLISFGEFSDYPSHPVGDVVKIDGRAGINSFKILTYYFGSDRFSSYANGLARLIFEVAKGEEVLAFSSEETLSRFSKCYQNGLKKQITPQLGYSFVYDATKESDDSSWEKSQTVDLPIKVYARDNQKCLLGQPVDCVLKHKGKGHYLVDLKEETVGLLSLSFVSPREQKLHISYGEHLESGHVLEVIENRDFGFDYFAKEGRNDFLPFFRRLGARYLELVFEEDVTEEKFSLRPVEYPFKVIPYSIKNPLWQKIYDTSVKTLERCYHDHYEDCPWREQCLYILDSANQMLCGYYCFDNSETVRSSLALILRSERNDGLLPICAPTTLDFVIPSFNLHIFGAVEEYVKRTGDLGFLNAVYPRLKRVIESFIGQVKNTRLINFSGRAYWNFYEWRPSLDYPSSDYHSDLIASCLFLIALQSMGRLALLCQKEDVYSPLASSLVKPFHEQFFVAEDGLYSMHEGSKSYSELGNSLAILSGLSTGREAGRIASFLKEESPKLIPVTLSCRRFYYDAILLVSKENESFVLKDIETRYKKMLDDGATTFYETELGAADFNGAGSLCHGWSALPIYYYHLFGVGKK